MTKFATLFAGMLTFSTVACVRSSPPTDSGIPKALTAESMFDVVGKEQGVKIRAMGGFGESTSAYEIDIDREFYVTFASGMCGQFVAALKREMENRIKSLGGTEIGVGTSGSGDDLVHFKFNYKVGANHGFVKVYSFDDAKSGTHIIVACHEDRR